MTDWIDELFEEDARTLYKEWLHWLYRTKKMYECDNFQEAAQYYIDQIRNDEHIPERDLKKQYKRIIKK